MGEKEKYKKNKKPKKYKKKIRKGNKKRTYGLCSYCVKKTVISGLL